MAKEMKSESEVEIAPLNPDTPQKATESVRAKRARSPPLRKSEVMEEATVDYARYRDERIKANMERMQKLGLHNLSRGVRIAFGTQKRRQFPVPSDGSKKKVDPNPSLPPRRSSRLRYVAPVDYTVGCSKKTHDLAKAIRKSIEEGSGEEFYTEEHEKLLGSCKVPWTLFVDNYDKDGKRIYDANGKICHQCGKKTTGYHTSCSKCQLEQGQLCGDCLYMRYGENVLEAIKNPDWICPACRGICNCRCCRNKKGWYAFGYNYRKIVNLGYKSIAHYLIQTRRKPGNSSKGPCSETGASMSDNTKATDKNQPKPEVKSERNDESMIIAVSPDESRVTDDEESLAKRCRVEKMERCNVIKHEHNW